MGKERRHRRNHPPYPMEQCWHCQRDRVHCRSKIRFSSWVEADQWVTEFNEERAYTDTVWRYYCDWCDGWHMYQPTDKEGLRQVERMRRKWLLQRRTQTEQLNRYAGPGAVEKQRGTVRRYREHTSAVEPVSGQGVGAAGDDEIKVEP